MRRTKKGPRDTEKYLDPGAEDPEGEFAPE